MPDYPHHSDTVVAMGIPKPPYDDGEESPDRPNPTKSDDFQKVPDKKKQDDNNYTPDSLTSRTEART